ncbi:MAG TPA: class I SAM-dependent methyltransferase [Polyangiaceae bacterium]|jgi:SAM-dependent methyltransferase|nr:class I SAM-dependent methyltransferase [Polyangiaceae bacterium]
MDETKIEAADRALFDRIARDYVRKDLTESCRIAREQRLRQTLRHVASVASVGARVGHLLEVGCGGGFAARYLDGLYETYTGVDYSEELVGYARQYNAGPGREFLSANIKDFETSRRFDVVLMVGVLHHMEDPAGILVQLRQLLTPAGIVVVNEPQRGNPGISALRWIRKRVDSSYSPDQVEFSEDELRELFERSGYDVETYPQGLLSTPFAETQPFPPVVSLMLSRFATRLDPTLERILQTSPARRLAWNAVVVGRQSVSR